MATQQSPFSDLIGDERKPYETPELIELGDVADLTHVVSVIVQ